LPQQVSPARGERLGADLAARLADAMAGSPPLLTTWTHWPQGAGPQGSESGTEAGRLVLTFADGAADARLRRAIAGLPELRATVEPAAGALVEAVARAGNRIDLWADADTSEGAAQLADAVSRGLARRGWKVLTAGHTAADTAWVLRWDEARLAALGLDSGDLDRRVSGGLGGMSVGRLDIPGVSRGLVIEAAPGDPLGTLPINASAAGEERRVVPLAALASLRREGRAPVAEREDGRPTARVVLFARSADGGRALAEARQATGAGERIRLGGDARELIRSFAQLRLTLVLSLLLVLLTVVALYESLRVALVIMATVPLAVAGAAAALAAAAQTLNLMSFLGLILLVGLVVNNSIVLVHRSEQLRAAGTGAAEAVLAAARERYRPIVLTTLTTACGMLPLAVLGGEGIELRRPLAVAVLGGLATAWIASLLVVPALYAHFARRQQ
jgi:HAE1 family hydrophobic/amphiphilic exporter-1